MSKAKAQSGRKSGAIHAETQGVSASQIDKHGGWSSNSRTGAYVR